MITSSGTKPSANSSRYPVPARPRPTDHAAQAGEQQRETRQSPVGLGMGLHGRVALVAPAVRALRDRVEQPDTGEQHHGDGRDNTAAVTASIRVYSNGHVPSVRRAGPGGEPAARPSRNLALGLRRRVSRSEAVRVGWNHSVRWDVLGVCGEAFY